MTGMRTKMTNNLLPVSFSKKARKQLKKFRKSDRTLFMLIEEAITILLQAHGAGAVQYGDLHGDLGYDVYQQINARRQINYEVCFQVEMDNNGVIIASVFMGHRENFYDDLKQHLGI